MITLAGVPYFFLLTTVVAHEAISRVLPTRRYPSGTQRTLHDVKDLHEKLQMPIPRRKVVCVCGGGGGGGIVGGDSGVL